MAQMIKKMQKFNTGTRIECLRQRLLRIEEITDLRNIGNWRRLNHYDTQGTDESVSDTRQNDARIQGRSKRKKYRMKESEASKVTKETTSFADFRKSLLDWAREDTNRFGPVNVSLLECSSSDLRECYQDGLSLAGTAEAILSGL